MQYWEGDVRLRLEPTIYADRTNRKGNRPLEINIAAYGSTSNLLPAVLDLARHWIDTCWAHHAGYALSGQIEFRGLIRLLDDSNLLKN